MPTNYPGTRGDAVSVEPAANPPTSSFSIGLKMDDSIRDVGLHLGLGKIAQTLRPFRKKTYRQPPTGGGVAKISPFIPGRISTVVTEESPTFRADQVTGKSKRYMNTGFPDSASSSDAVFSSLRAKLDREVSGSAMLSELLEKVNRMQECHECPEDFKVRFDEFVARADEYLHVVRPFFPALVQFLPSRNAERQPTEPQNLEGFGEPDLAGEVV